MRKNRIGIAAKDEQRDRACSRRHFGAVKPRQNGLCLNANATAGSCRRSGGTQLKQRATRRALWKVASPRKHHGLFAAIKKQATLPAQQRPPAAVRAAKGARTRE